MGQATLSTANQKVWAAGVKMVSMLRVGRLITALCLFSAVACAQDDPLAWFPLQAGSRWLYQYEWKSGNRDRPDIERWTTEETITGWVRIPEGLVVLRDARQQPNPAGEIVTRRVIAPNGQLRYVQQGNSHGALIARDSEPYLIHGNCIYTIQGGWDNQRQELRPEYRKYLSDAAVAPNLCFPLETGRTWGNNDIPWLVEPASAPYPGAVHISSSHFGSGGSADVWFQRGVGIVGEHYIHNGTYDEYSKTLLSPPH
jgi:hypothetical protein